MEILAHLLALLILARAFGEAAERLGQPASVGEIMAGVILAGFVAWSGTSIPFIAQLASSSVLEPVANLGIFFLVLLAGIETEPKEIAESSAASLAVAVGGMLVPLMSGFGLGWLFLPESDLKSVQALLIGVALSISAIPAIVKVLTDLDLMHTQIGEIVVGAAVVDDVLGLLLLAVLLAMIETGHPPGSAVLAILLGKVALFFVVTATLGAHVYPRVSRGLKTMQAAAHEFTAVAVVGLAYGLLAELLGMHWILGAFMTGLYFERSRVGLRAYNEIKLICATITRGFLGPLFFISIGLRVDLSAISAIPLFLSLLVAVAFAGKIVGAGLPALWMGLSRWEAMAVGAGMTARGAVELVVLNIAYEAGLFAQGNQEHSIVAHLFSSLILMGVVTTLLAPILLRYALRRIRGLP